MADAIFFMVFDSILKPKFSKAVSSGWKAKVRSFRWFEKFKGPVSSAGKVVESGELHLQNL